MKTKEEIGIVSIKYDPKGKVIRSNFMPSIIKSSADVLKQINEIEASSADVLKQINEIEASSADVLKQKSDLVFASWFTKTNEIELADREKYKITSEVILCQKYASGKIRTCIIQYFFEEI